MPQTAPRGSAWSANAGIQAMIDHIDARKQWYMGKPFSGAPPAHVQTVQAWVEANTCGDEDICVAFIDDGFDVRHPDLARVPVRRSYRYDFGFPPRFVEGPSLKRLAPRSSFHGTPCLGLALGRPTRAGGIVGVAPGCSALLVSCDVTHDEAQVRIREILRRISPFVHVVCLAFHPDVGSNQEPDFALSNCLDELSKSGGPDGNGIVFCVSAGNDDVPVFQPIASKHRKRNFLTGSPPASLEGPFCNVFASSPSTIAVAASSAHDVHSRYSNWGPEICLTAPSDDYDPLRLKRVDRRTITAPMNRRFNRPVVPPLLRGAYRAGQPYSPFGGTSAATAIAAGAAALVRSVAPHLSAAEVREVLALTADKILDGSARGPRRFGVYGPDSRSYWFGYGRLNVLRAVRRAAALQRQSAA